MPETFDIPHELLIEAPANGKTGKAPEIIFLSFADALIPVFKEVKNKDYIKYGDDNRYPEYLTYLFNKSGKHGAIISAKAKYIFGLGFENGDFVINRLGESLNDISRKAILDIEIYGGFRLEVIWNLQKKISEIYHVDFTTLRLSKEGGSYYYKETWEKNKDHISGTEIQEFNAANPVGTQIFAYNEYRPMTRFYPLPSYISCNNSIETDIEISIYWLSAIRNGMNPSKMIQFFQGEPTQENKREIEAQFKKKFSGSGNAGKFILVFNAANSVDQTVKVDDISGSDLDKMFIELNKTVQQEIFSGHQVTSPLLFGIMEPGKLGGNTELQTAYSIFQNTYSKPKADAFSKEVTWLMGFSPKVGQYELQPSDPIGVQFDIKDVINALPKEFIFDKLNIPIEQRALPNVGSDNKPTDPTTGMPAATAADTPPINENLKNLSAKQLQHVNRVIRQYKQGKMAGPMAKNLLRNGYGLSEDDINEILGITPVQLSFSEEEDYIVAMFDACGDSKDDFEILKSKRVSFSEQEAEADEEIFIGEAFKTYDVTRTEDRILELIKKDKLVTPEVIAETIGQSVAYVNSKIENLVQRGYLEQSTGTSGEDTVIERIIPEAASIETPPPIKGTVPPTQIFIKYSYEGPQDAKNRPFCAKMMQLRRLYSRAEIEKISARLGYSVFDRRGGFWTRKGTHDTTPYCRHNWKSNLIVKKGGEK